MVSPKSAVTLGASRASSHSSVLILLDLSSVFDSQPPNPPLHSDWTSLTLLSPGSHHTWQIAPFRSPGTAPCPDSVFSVGLVSLKAQYQDRLCFSLYTRSLGSAVTINGFSDNCSSLSPHPPPTPTLWCSSLNAWQTSRLDSCSSPQTQP